MPTAQAERQSRRNSRNRILIGNVVSNANM